MQICPNCGVTLDTEAEVFLHAELHAEPYGAGLGKLPYILMPRVAKLMADFLAMTLRQASKCPICFAGLVKCDVCDAEWCLDHQPNPLVCPKCGARP